MTGFVPAGASFDQQEGAPTQHTCFFQFCSCGVDVLFSSLFDDE